MAGTIQRVATSTLTYSQDLSSDIFSEASELAAVDDLCFEIHEEDLCDVEFDLREDVHSHGDDFCDAPVRPSESVVLLETVQKTSSPRNQPVAKQKKPSRDVSKLVDSLLGAGPSNSSTASSTPIEKPMLVTVPIRNRTSSSTFSAKPLSVPMPKKQAKVPVPKPIARSRYTCPDGWIPRHNCDEFCRTVFQQFRN